MKDGRTHLGYKAEHVVDLETGVLLSAQVHHGTAGDTQTLVPGVIDAQRNLILAGSESDIEEVAADKGYHANETIAQCTRSGLRTYIPQPNSRHSRVWTDKPEEVQAAVVNNRRRTRRDKGRRLGRLRSEKVERSFTHVCDTGGARRTWLRGLEKINKRYALTAAAHNLGVLMRTVFGVGKPRGLTAGWAAACAALLALLRRCLNPLVRPVTTLVLIIQRPQPATRRAFSTGC